MVSLHTVVFEKFEKARGDDYTTACMLDYNYLKKD